MGTERQCPVCGVLFSHANPTYKTCGSPRCRRVNQGNSQAAVKRRNRALERERKQRMAQRIAERNIRSRDKVISDEAGRRKIVQRMQKELDHGIPEMHAALTVARVTKETPAVVLSVWRSMRRD